LIAETYLQYLISISSARPAISFGWPCPIGKVVQKIEQPLAEAGGIINPDGSKIAMQTWSKKGEIKPG
jgi:hypothetical protein